jgi:hypothetical protein
VTAPDVVIPVRKGEGNEELRYALRSLCCLPHGRVWIAGYKPSWVGNVGHIDVAQVGTKHENALRNLLAACAHPEVSEEFVLWNDDFFLLEPLDAVPVYHCGPMTDFIRARKPLGDSAWMLGVRATEDVLHRLGHPDPVCYELHTPLPMTKSGTVEAMALALPELAKRAALQIKTLYGNIHGLGGERREDVKVFRPHDRWVGGPFLSTIDRLWGRHEATKMVMRKFPDRGPYEKERKRR